VKFSCERCGKKYATAETPAPGRVYKLKCKACGHLIVLRISAPAIATSEIRPATSPGIAAPAEVSSPPVNLEVAPPEPAAASEIEPLPPEPVNGSYPGGASPSPRATQEISMAGLGATAFTPPPQPPPSPALPPPAPTAAEGGGGYVDLFAETPGKDEPADPFAAAARASLPEGYGKDAPAPDPLAVLMTPPPEPQPRAREAALASKVPSIPKAAQQRSNVPLVLIGVGALVLVGILAFVLLGGKNASPPPPAPAPVQVGEAPAPPPPPPPEPAAAAPAQAPVPEAAPSPAENAEKSRAERAEKTKADKKSASEERLAREERKQRERDAKARERDRREAENGAAAGLADPEGGLTQGRSY
jgi:hypothetical protein